MRVILIVSVLALVSIVINALTHTDWWERHICKDVTDALDSRCFKCNLTDCETQCPFDDIQ